MIPLVGFLPATDPRVLGTVEAIERELVEDGFVHRYLDDENLGEVDGLPPGEGAFLPCTFWLADNLSLLGRQRRGARASSSGCSRCATTWGSSRRSTTPARAAWSGNFPQAFSHVGLVNAAVGLSR